MGKLVSQPIKSFFQGVSRQPDSFRNPGQVDEAINVQFSVERGGFTKRVPTKTLKKLTASVFDGALHTIDRDSTERYAVTYVNGDLRVFTYDGTEKTVTNVGSAAAYLAGLSPSEIAFVSIADYTLVLNRTKTVAMSAAVAAAQENKAVLSVVVNAAGNYTVIINGLTATFAVSTHTTVQIATGIAAALVTALGAGWTVTQDGSCVFVYKNDGSSFTIEHSDPYGDQGMKVTYRNVKASTDLPPKAPNNLVVRVGSDSKSEFYVKAEQLNSGANDVRWIETVKPGDQTTIDAATMPHELVRLGSGDFEFRPSTWKTKTVGTLSTVPLPDFVGTVIKDMSIHRNRLELLAGETCILSAAGDYFNFFRTKSTEILDDDPYSHTASTNEVAILEWAVPFRRALFLTSANVQFEISGDLLTPKKSSIDNSTKYGVSVKCRPVAIGDSLYLPASNGTDAVLFEYIYDDNSVSNVAVDSTKHVKGYIPATIHDMTGDPVNGNLFILTEGDTSSVYVYTFFWNGDEKVQQAYGKWSFDGTVRAISFMAGHLYLLIQRSDGLFLEKVSLGNEGFASYSFPPRLDRQVEVTGSYNAGTDTTTWTLPFTPTSSTKIVTSNLFASQSKRMASPVLTVASSSTVTASGDWSGQPAIIGFPYTALVRLSKLYVRDANGAAILGGRVQVKTITFRYEDTGYFKVRITPTARPVKTKTFAGRVLGSISNIISGIPILSGKFRAIVGANSEEVDIEIENDSHIPCTITSAEWVGFFNELTRQEG